MVSVLHSFCEGHFLKLSSLCARMQEFVKAGPDRLIPSEEGGRREEAGGRREEG